MKNKSLKKLVYGISLVLSILGTASGAHAEPKISFKNKIYKVSGKNIKEIKNSMANKRLLKAANDEGFDASTEYSLSWKYTFQADEYGCRAKNADVSVVISHEMPHLTDSYLLSQEDKESWHSYYKSLIKHELGHAELGIAAAEEIEWEINNMIPKQSCEVVSGYVQAIVTKIINKYHNENISYDMATGHGISQGAILLASK